jgi:hypothetical protein
VPCGRKRNGESTANVKGNQKALRNTARGLGAAFGERELRWFAEKLGVEFEVVAPPSL